MTHIQASGRSTPDDLDGLMNEFVLHWARIGDWSLLIKHIEKGDPITPPMRDFILSVLRGKIKRPDNRAPSVKKAQRDFAITAFVLCKQRRGATLTEAKKAAQEVFKKPIPGVTFYRADEDNRPEFDWSTIGRAVKKYKNDRAVHAFAQLTLAGQTTMSRLF